MDPPSSVCRLHPGVAVTGFCPACLRDRLAGLQPPSAADLRRCKSFSYARSAASQLEPQRRSCDLFGQQQPVIAVPEEEEYHFPRRTEAEPAASSRKSSSSFGGLLGKKLQQWRRKKKEPPPVVRVPPPEEAMPTSRRHRQHSFRIEDLDGGRRSNCDLPELASWDARSGPMFDRLTTPPAAATLSVEEDYDMPPVVPRSDGQIPVEEDYYCYDNNPGGCAQTRDYYLDSSSSSRRRRSVDRSTASGRNSFSDVVVNPESLLQPSGRMMAATNNANANARVSPAMAAEFYHAQHQSVLVQHHRQYRRDYWDHQPAPSYDFPGGSSGSFFRANKDGMPPPANKPKKQGIKGWSIWGLIQKKSSSSRKPEADHRSSSAGVRDRQVEEEYPWPELIRARGYNGQMLRCNSSISARSSFSGGTAAAMIGGSARRSVSGMDTQHEVVHNGSSSGRTTRRDEFLLQRTLSTRSSSYSRSGHDPPMGVLPANYQFCSRPNQNGSVRSSKSKPSGLPRRSTLGPYS